MLKSQINEPQFVRGVKPNVVEDQIAIDDLQRPVHIVGNAEERRKSRLFKLVGPYAEQQLEWLEPNPALGEAQHAADKPVLMEYMKRVGNKSQRTYMEGRKILALVRERRIALHGLNPGVEVIKVPALPVGDAGRKSRVYPVFNRSEAGFHRYRVAGRGLQMVDSFPAELEEGIRGEDALEASDVEEASA